MTKQYRILREWLQPGVEYWICEHSNGPKPNRCGICDGVLIDPALDWHDKGCVKRYGAVAEGVALCACEKRRAAEPSREHAVFSDSGEVFRTQIHKVTPAVVADIPAFKSWCDAFLRPDLCEGKSVAVKLHVNRTAE